jgi:uncharacterized repeat protein (TIGR01451 family)
VGDDTGRPDGQGTFRLNVLNMAASIDGNTVLFRSLAADLTPNEIWVYDIPSQSMKKLVDFNTPAPGGAGNFSDLDGGIGGPLLRDGAVIFTGRNGAQSANGVYTVPAAGGVVSLVADTNTAVPGQGVSGNFFNFGQFSKLFGSNSISAGRVAFVGTFGGGPTGNDGLYFANNDGTGLAPIIDSLHPIHTSDGDLTGFSVPSISGNTVVFSGATHGIYSAALSGAYGTTSTLVDIHSSLPGNPAPLFFPSPTRLTLDGATFAFVATDAGTQTHATLYTGNTAGGPFTKVAAVGDMLDGLVQINPGSFDGFSLNKGQIMFHAYDTTINTEGLYVWNGSSNERVVSKGETIPGGTVIQIGLPGPNALSNGRFVFGAWGSQYSALYLATPLSKTADLAASLSSSTMAPGKGETFTVQAKVTNSGPGNAENAKLLVTIPPQFQFVSASTGSLAGNIVTASFGTIASGSSASTNIVLSPAAVGIASIAAAALSDTLDTDSANDKTAITLTAVNDVSAKVRSLLTQALSLLSTAKKPLPPKPSKKTSKGKKSKITARRIEIMTARVTLASIAGQLVAIEAASGAQIRAQLSNFSAANLKTLVSDVKKALSMRNRSSPAFAKAWRLVKKLLLLLGK